MNKDKKRKLIVAIAIGIGVIYLFASGYITPSKAERAGAKTGHVIDSAAKSVSSFADGVSDSL